MRRSTWKTVSTLVTTIVMAGCSESTIIAPVSEPVAPTLVSNAPQGMFVLDPPASTVLRSSSNSGKGNANVSADFTVTPSGGIFQVGDSYVYFPDHAICEASDGYGASKWDAPCTPTKSSVKIHAEVQSSSAGTWIDFDQHIRFVPSSNPSDWVVVAIANPAALGAKNYKALTVRYALSIGDKGVDESTSDPTLQTFVDTQHGYTIRRIKHFSGYTSSGRACDPATDGPDCIDDGTGVGGGH